MPLDPSELLVGQITEDEIREFVHDGRRIDSFSRGVADLTLPMRIPGTKLKAALQWILGVNYMDNSNNLRRSLPMFHSFHCWAWAESIQVLGMGQRGDDTASQIWEFQVMPSKWEYYDCLVTFGMPKYQVLADDEITLEYERFVSKELTGDVQIVSVENGQVVYEASGFLWQLQPHNATIPVARREGAGIRVTWHGVPQEYVQAAPTGLEVDDGLPTKLLQVQGKCNSVEFWGQPAETLLCTGAQFDKYVSPVMTDAVGQLYFLYDIHLDFMWVKQLDSQIGAGVGETRRGHNLLLGPSMKYWYATNATSAKPVFEPVSFAKIFTYHTDTFP